jgi:hypothetical protein
MIQTFLKNKARPFYAPVFIQQTVSTADRPANGPIWASQTTFQHPKNNAVLTAVIEAIADLAGGSVTDLTDVQVRWSGYRAKVQQSRSLTSARKKKT